MALRNVQFLRNDARQFVIDYLISKHIPERLHDEAFAAAYDSEHLRGLTAGIVCECAFQYAMDKLTPDEALTVKIANMKDRDLLEAIYRKLFA